MEDFTVSDFVTVEVNESAFCGRVDESGLVKVAGLDPGLLNSVLVGEGMVRECGCDPAYDFESLVCVHKV